MLYRCLMTMCVAFFLASGPALASGTAWQIDVEGAIGPATADHFVRGLGSAEQAGASVVVLRIDTPGGLDTAMRDMIKAILAAEVPVIAWVGPSGARAASAGTYLLYAAHVAAMAPGTNLGAATPVQIGGGGMPGMPRDKSGEEPADAQPAKSAMEKKIVNDAVAYIQSLAQLRGRNAEWAEEAVREGVSLSAEDALAASVVDIVAPSVATLLAEADGRAVVLNGDEQVLATAGLAVQALPMDWRSQFLAVITNPNVAYMLMLVGIYGLLLEFYNPGIGLPGVLGAICLLLALYAFQALPVSYAGFALVLLGIALMLAEAFSPSFGVLGLGGVGAFVFGSIMLMDTDLPAFRVALPMIMAFAVFSFGLLVFALGMMLRARQQDLVSGVERLLGSRAAVESVANDQAWVRLDGELWAASCDDPLEARDEVTVVAIEGNALRVSKLNKE